MEFAVRTPGALLGGRLPRVLPSPASERLDGRARRACLGRRAAALGCTSLATASCPIASVSASAGARLPGCCKAAHVGARRMPCFCAREEHLCASARGPGKRGWEATASSAAWTPASGSAAGDRRNCGPWLTETCVRVPAGARGWGDSRGPIMSGSSRVATAGETVAQSRMEQVRRHRLPAAAARPELRCSACRQRRPLRCVGVSVATVRATRANGPLRIGRSHLCSHRVSASGNRDSKAFRRTMAPGYGLFSLDLKPMPSREAPRWGLQLARSVRASFAVRRGTNAWACALSMRLRVGAPNMSSAGAGSPSGNAA